MQSLKSQIITHIKQMFSAEKYDAHPALSTISISMIKNEQDIIEPFIRHNSKLMDLMFIIDNNSHDETKSICLKLSRELRNIIIINNPSTTYDQSTITSQALRYIQAATFSDFIFFLDADEFISASNQDDLLMKLANIPIGSCGLMPWKTFIPDPQLSESEQPEPLKRMRFRRRLESPQYHKAALRLGGTLDQRLTVSQGNHMVFNHKNKPLKTIYLHNIPLLHFPVRSMDQILAKGAIGHNANKARKDYIEGQGYQWERLHNIFLSGAQLNERQLAIEAVNYAQSASELTLESRIEIDNHNINETRKYSNGRFAHAEKLILASQEHHKPWAPPSLLNSPGKIGTRSEITTSFNSTWHWLFPFIDEPLIRAAIEILNPQSIIDLGCGNGVYTLLYKHLGVNECLSVDGLDVKSTVLDEATYIKSDLSLPFNSGKKFDLSICLEVVEHLRPDSTCNIFDTISNNTSDDGSILFSMAAPGQPGNGHINCLDIPKVLDLWSDRGWYPDLKMTLGLRGISTMSWFRRNIILLNRKNDPKLDICYNTLRQIGQMRYTWYEQKPGHRDVAFRDLYPNAKSAYGVTLGI